MPEGESLSEVASKEFPRKLLEGKAKLEQGSFEEAKVTLCEALSISNEVIISPTCCHLPQFAASSHFWQPCNNSFQ